MSSAQKKYAVANEPAKKELLFRESFVFVLDLIQFTELLEQKGKFSLAKKLFIAGTELGEIINELRYVEKNKNYISLIKKLKKLAHNIKFLLQLCKYSEGYPNPFNLINEIEDIIKQSPEIK